MKINMTEHIKNRDSLVTHIILNCMTDTLMNHIQKIKADDDLLDVDNDLMLDVVLSVNDHELSLEKFMKDWQSQVEHYIKTEAKEMIKERIGDRFSDVEDLLTDLQGRLDEEVDKRLEDWERE